MTVYDAPSLNEQNHKYDNCRVIASSDKRSLLGYIHPSILSLTWLSFQ